VSTWAFQQLHNQKLKQGQRQGCLQKAMFQQGCTNLPLISKLQIVVGCGGWGVVARCGGEPRRKDR